MYSMYSCSIVPRWSKSTKTKATKKKCLEEESSAETTDSHARHSGTFLVSSGWKPTLCDCFLVNATISFTLLP